MSRLGWEVGLAVQGVVSCIQTQRMDLLSKVLAHVATFVLRHNLVNLTFQGRARHTRRRRQVQSTERCCTVHPNTCS